MFDLRVGEIRVMHRNTLRHNEAPLKRGKLQPSCLQLRTLELARVVLLISLSFAD